MSEAEQKADTAYLSHHGNCPVCIAAGKGYGKRCEQGAPLWIDYKSHPVNPPQKRKVSR